MAPGDIHLSIKNISQICNRMSILQYCWDKEYINITIDLSTLNLNQLVLTDVLEKYYNKQNIGIIELIGTTEFIKIGITEVKIMIDHEVDVCCFFAFDTMCIITYIVMYNLTIGHCLCRQSILFYT